MLASHQQRQQQAARGEEATAGQGQRRGKGYTGAPLCPLAGLAKLHDACIAAMCNSESVKAKPAAEQQQLRAALGEGGNSALAAGKAKKAQRASLHDDGDTKGRPARLGVGAENLTKTERDKQLQDSSFAATEAAALGDREETVLSANAARALGGGMAGAAEGVDAKPTGAAAAVAVAKNAAEAKTLRRALAPAPRPKAPHAASKETRAAEARTAAPTSTPAPVAKAPVTVANRLAQQRQAALFGAGKKKKRR